MKTDNASSLTSEELERKLSTLPYFKEVRRHDEDQFRLLIEHSRLLLLEPGEYLVRKGDKDRALYCLVRGELEACADDNRDSVLGTLRPGEVFGETALLRKSARTAHIRVPESGRPSTVFATDFSVLLEDDGGASLKTQLIFYRQMVHMLRWRNDAYKIRFPDSPLAREPYLLRPFSGTPGTREELLALRTQAEYLSERLVSLNRELGQLRTGT
jgi:CRP-like cAMP-binding protein